MASKTKEHSEAQQLLDEGFFIVNEVIPPSELETVRSSCEKLVERQRELWEHERGENEPLGGRWETERQPRLGDYEQFIDSETAPAIEFLYGDKTLGTCLRIMGAPDASPTSFMLMCNPVEDHGPAEWHRDIHPIDQAPLCGLEQDLQANGPCYLQWNIPLYDDNVLWVVPGSHRRPNTSEENEQLCRDRKVPLPGSIPVDLKAGDGVVYTNTILHWGSNYSCKLRRTVHLGYRSYGGRLFPYVPQMRREARYESFLNDKCAALCSRHQLLYDEECNRIEAFYRAIIAKDKGLFYAGLETFHPGENNRIVALILFSKLAYKICIGSHPNRESYGNDWSQDMVIGPRFSKKEKELLWSRFESLDHRLQADEEQFVPGFQSGPMHYFFEEIPEGLDVDSFVANW